MATGMPLILFRKEVRSIYTPVMPVYVVDENPEERTTVSNGLALCKIHHAAYDQNMLGVTPDYEIRIAVDLLGEIDGPMLKHGLQEMHGRALHVPRKAADRPDRGLLAWRFAGFAANS